MTSPSPDSSSAGASKSPHPALEPLLGRVKARAEAAGVFGPVLLRDNRLICQARASAAPASYRLESDRGRIWVSLVMADRWLSESIESDLVHTGDKLEDLLEEELAELAHGSSNPTARPTFEHYRSDDLLFTFRSPLPIELGSADVDQAADTASLWLLAYEATFRNLGDMEADEED
jgi:hypothetical protein